MDTWGGSVVRVVWLYIARSQGGSFMRATGLRRVCGLVAGTALVAGCLLTTPFGARSAQADEGALKSALDDYAAGKYEDALKKLQEYVQANPGDEEVYAVLRGVDDKVKLRALAAGGDHERLMRYLLDKAKPTVEAKKRDADGIKKLVDEALSGEIDVRRRASLELGTRSGDYAVPYLLPHLADADAEKVVNTIFAFHSIGGEAVLPLAEAMGTADARQRGYIVVVLGDIGDVRALPVLRRAAEKDADDNVKAKATAAIAKIGPAGGSMSAADSYVRMGNRYYSNDPSVITEVDQVHNIWKWEGDALVRYEVAASLFGAELAEMHAVDALAIDPSNVGARSLLVRAILAQKLAGELMGDKAPESLKGAWDLAASQGFGAATAALSDALAARDWDVAVEAARLCAQTYGKQPLEGHPLGAALASPAKRVQYAAAIAALRMSPAGGFQNSNQVPPLAAQAASETMLREVFVIDDHDDSRARVGQDLREAGYVVAADKDGYAGVGRLKASPAVDLVVVRADLGEAQTIPMERWRSTLAVIDEAMADFRTKNVKIMVLVGGASADQIAAKKAFLSAKYGDKLAGFIEEPLVTTAYLPLVAEAIAKADLNKERAMALKVAADAADAFASTNPCCTAWDFKVAIDPLANNAQEGGSDDVKMNSVRALGNLKAGGGVALAAILNNAEAKPELKLAAAAALGQVLSRVAPAGDEVAALVAAAKAGGDLGSVAMKALGMVQGLPPEVARGVFGDHRLGVGKKGE